jgi:predicted lactoylglutathione lyase
MATKIFVNIPVKDLERSTKFYESLGYSCNANFTNEDAASMVISDDIYVMLLTEAFFTRFTQKTIVDATKATEAIICLSADSKEAVDSIIEKAKAAGGKEYREAEDHGWMYQRSIEDLDGHQWEYAWIDPTGIPGQ